MSTCWYPTTVTVARRAADTHCSLSVSGFWWAQSGSPCLVDEPWANYSAPEMMFSPPENPG